MINLVAVDITNLKQQIGNELVIEQDEDFGRIEEIELISPLWIKLHLINKGQAIEITGSLRGEVLLQCNRCLEPFNYKLERDFKIELFKKKELFEEGVEFEGKWRGGKLKREDLEKSFYQGDSVDLRDEIRQQIILSLPMTIICQDDCQGLCSHCGVNLNKITCDCSLKGGF